MPNCATSPGTPAPITLSSPGSRMICGSRRPVTGGAGSVRGTRVAIGARGAVLTGLGMAAAQAPSRGTRIRARAALRDIIAAFPAMNQMGGGGRAQKRGEQIGNGHDQQRSHCRTQHEAL